MKSSKPPGDALPPTQTLKTSVNSLHKGMVFAERYQIIEELGRGGMGIVYKAEDTKLKRLVALKYLRSEVLAGGEERIRFLREAQAAAALNHPSICTIYEIEEFEDRSFIAMEYIPGESLKDKMSLRPFALEDAVTIAIQVAEALEHAHARGIVHRDIKSSNIIVTETGTAKIMDFGLAKLTGTSLLTKAGTTVGTIAYMSPEQTLGKAVDKRTDLWSLGVVLFELLTGEYPFRGDYDQAVIHAILDSRPEPLTSLRSGMPLELEGIVDKCLEKDPDYRYQSAGDLRVDLHRILRDAAAGQPSGSRPKAFSPRRGARSARLWLLPMSFLLGLLLAVAGYFLWWRFQGTSELALQTAAIGGRYTGFPDWSPDGGWLVFASDKAGSMDVWKRPADGGEAVQLTNEPADETQPDWSPDGASIAYASNRDDGGIFVIPQKGGSPYHVCGFGNNPTWSPDGDRIAFDWQGNIYVTPIRGGEPRLVVGGTSATPHMVWLPDGERLIFWHRTKGDIHVISLSNGDSTALHLVPSGKEIAGLSYSHEEKELIFSMGPFGGYKDLWTVKLDTRRARVKGKPHLLLVTPTDDIQCSVSPDGQRTAFTASRLERHLWAYPLDAAAGTIAEPARRVTFGCSNNYYPDVAPDGDRIVWTSHITSQGVLSIKDLFESEEKKVTLDWGEGIREVGGSFSPDGKGLCYSSTKNGSYELWHLPSLGSIGLRLTETATPFRDILPVWSPDGGTIAFYSNRSGNWDIWSISAEGSREPLRLTQWDSDENYPTWSPDGSSLAFRTDKDGTGDIWAINADGSDPRPLVSHPAEEGWPAWAPDGRWLYFVSNRRYGVYNIWALSPNGDDLHQVTGFEAVDAGMPEFVLFTKFSISRSHLVLPREERTGHVYILEKLRK